MRHAGSRGTIIIKSGVMFFWDYKLKEEGIKQLECNEGERSIHPHSKKETKKMKETVEKEGGEKEQ